MYYAGWVVLILLGVGVGAWAFMWALRSGQFSEQERARFLPLRDEGTPTRNRSRKGTAGALCFLGLVAGLVVLSMAAALWLTVTLGKGLGE